MQSVSGVRPGDALNHKSDSFYVPAAEKLLAFTLGKDRGSASIHLKDGLSILEMNFEQLAQIGQLSEFERTKCVKQALDDYASPRQDLALFDQATIPFMIKMRWLRFYASMSWRILNWLQRVLALLALIILSPVLLLIAISVKFSSPGPILFRQARLGWLCCRFNIYKFRTMVQDAESSTGPVWASENDARYTRIGHLLRAMRLDELPQLINVVRGEMSLIGFRPIRYHFAHLLDQEIPHYELRFFVMPGITGWPQVWHDYAGSLAGQKTKFEYELHYLLWSKWQIDIEIIFRTLLAMIRRTGQ